MSILRRISNGRRHVFVSDKCRLGLSNAFERFLLNQQLDYPTMFIRQVSPAIVVGCNQSLELELNQSTLQTRDDKSRSVDIYRSSSGGGSVYLDEGNLIVGFIGNHSTQESFNTMNNHRIIIDAMKRVYGLDAKSFQSTSLKVNDLKIAHGTYKQHEISGNIYGLHRLSIYLQPNMHLMSKYSRRGVDIGYRLTALMSDGQTTDQFKQEIVERFMKVYPPRFSHTISIDDHDLTKGIRHGMSYGLSQKSFKDTPDRMNIREELEVVTIDDNQMLEIPEVKHIFEIRNSTSWLNRTIPKFTNRYEGSFDWGKVDLFFNIEDGHIKDVELYTDSTNIEIPDIIKEILIGKKFDKTELHDNFNDLLRHEIIHDSGAICIIDDVMRWLLSFRF
jgi:lipoate-protein ligase A